MIVTSFAREIKRLRTERGLTIRDLAARVGKSVAYLGKIETQGEVPTTQVIEGLARVLGADTRELLGLAKEVRLANAIRDVEKEYESAIASHPRSQSGEAMEQHTKGLRTMATVVSLINMKGGVGKTTLAMQLAHAAREAGLKTLAVDLDPQSNLSQALMKPKAYIKHLKANRPTVVTIFDEYVPPADTGSAPSRLKIEDVIVQGVGYWQDSTLDLIPSRLELSRTLKNPYEKGRLLAKALAKIQDRYDLVIIDCAPTESVLTDAAYFASRYILVPIKPEFMATIGLPLLARSLQEFKLKNEDHEIEIAGLVFNHSSSYSSGPEGQRAIADVNKEANLHGWHICNNQIRYSASYARSAREGTSIGSTSHARWEVVRDFSLLADEVFNLIGINQVTP